MAMVFTYDWIQADVASAIEHVPPAPAAGDEVEVLGNPEGPVLKGKVISAVPTEGPQSTTELSIVVMEDQPGFYELRLWVETVGNVGVRVGEQ